MLVLKRKARQTVRIGDDIEIMIVEIRNDENENTVRIGINAPRDVNIARGELDYQTPNV